MRAHQAYQQRFHYNENLKREEIRLHDLLMLHFGYNTEYINWILSHNVGELMAMRFRDYDRV